MSIFTAINQIPISDIIIDNKLDNPFLSKNISKSGSKIKCIFHNDDTPSWNIYPGDRQSYCFGCGKAHTSYDVLKHLDYSIEEMLELAESYGIDTNREEQDNISDELNLELTKLVSDSKDSCRADRKSCRSVEKAIKRIQSKRKT